MGGSPAPWALTYVADYIISGSTNQLDRDELESDDVMQEKANESA